MGGWGCSRGREGGGGVSSVAPSSWLKDVHVLALLLMTVIKRLEVIGMPGAGGGGRSARSSGALGGSPGTRDAAHLAWAAWYWAALAFALALAALPRRRWRWLPEAGAAGFDGEDVVEVEEASLSSMTSLAMVALPPLEERVKVADLPAFCMRWYTSNREASSSPIFCSDSEQMKAMRSSGNLVLSLSLQTINLSISWNWGRKDGPHSYLVCLVSRTWNIWVKQKIFDFMFIPEIYKILNPLWNRGRGDGWLGYSLSYLVFCTWYPVSCAWNVTFW